MNRHTWIGLSLLGAALSPSAQAQNPSLDSYIDGLKYDPRALLSVREAGSTDALPGRQNSGNGVIICTNEERGLTKELNNVTVLSPISGVVYPGALVRVNRRLAEGRPDALSLPRSPLTLSVDLPGLGNKGAFTVANPSNSSVRASIDSVLEYWNQTPVANGYVNTARSSLMVEKAYSQSQLALELGFSAKWASNELTSKLNVRNNAKQSTTIAVFRQVFYTVTMDLASRPSSVFADGVGLDDLRRVVGNDDPPGYVRSVDYGRIITVRMDTNSSETESDLEGTLRYLTSGGVNLNADVKARYERIANNSQFTVLTLGGNAEVATRVMQPGNLDEFYKVIRENSTYSRGNPGFPIAYSVAFLRDNQTATMAFTTSYTESDCKEYNNGFVKLMHEGWYVGKWQVDWTERAADGKGTVERSWHSGNVTAPWQKTIPLEGDAQNVRIRGWSATGLAWDPWREAINHTENGPTNKCYRIHGTTLKPVWDNNCS